MVSGLGPPDDIPESGLSTSRASTPPFASGSPAEPRRVWRPEPGAGQLVGVTLASGGFLLTVVAAHLTRDAEGPGRIVWALVVLLALPGTTLATLLLIQLRSIRYVIEAEALVIAMRGKRIEVPFHAIVDIVFRPRDVINVDGYERVWPGFFDSWASTTDGRWRSLATTAPQERVRIRTRNGSTVAISPDRPVLFVEALNTARQLPRQPLNGRLLDDDPPPTPAGLPAELIEPSPLTRRPAPRARAQRPVMPTPVAYRILRERIIQGDPVASRLLAMSLLVLIAMVFLAAWKVDTVTRPLAVKWNADGEAVWFVRPDGFWLIDGVWIYPATVAAIVAINAALATLAAAFERLREARLLLSASFVTGALMLVAMVRTTGLF